MSVTDTHLSQPGVKNLLTKNGHKSRGVEWLSHKNKRFYNALLLVYGFMVNGTETLILCEFYLQCHSTRLLSAWCDYLLDIDSILEINLT